MTFAPSATCTQHPLREAVGICVVCRNALCSDCITKFDGINHCRPCIEKLARNTAAARPAARRRLVPGWLVASLVFGLVTGLSYFLLDVLMPGAGSP